MYQQSELAPNETHKEGVIYMQTPRGKIKRSNNTFIGFKTLQNKQKTNRDKKVTYVQRSNVCPGYKAEWFR